MAKNRLFPALASLALAASLVACGSEAPTETAEDTTADAAPMDVADMEPQAIVKARHDNFEEIGDAFKAIRGELEGSEPDYAKIATQAQIIDTNAGKVGDYFPEGTGPDAVKTEALATIWEKPEEFSAAVDKLTTASATLLTAANAADASAVGAAVKDLGSSCKSCHDQFREEDD